MRPSVPPPGTETREPMESCVMLILGLSVSARGRRPPAQRPGQLATGKGGGAPHNPIRQPCAPALFAITDNPKHHFCPQQMDRVCGPVPSPPRPASLRARLPLGKKVNMASHRLRVKNVPVPQSGLPEGPTHGASRGLPNRHDGGL